MNNNSIQYHVEGSVRGRISSHRTLDAAIKSLRRDQRVCRGLSSSGSLTRCYSDCSIVRADGEPLSDREHETIYRD